MRNGFWVAGFGLVMSAGLAAQDKPEDVIREALKSLNPEIRIDAVRPSPMSGVYEVTVPGQVVYVTGDGKYLMQGMLLDIPNKVDLTEKRRSELRRTLLAAAPSSQRIVFKPKGEVKHTVAVFTDIDCGYCRKMHSHIAEYNERGIQVDYLFFPRSGPGTPSFNKAVSVWCAADQKKAFTAAKSGVDPQPLQCDNPIAEEFQLGMQVGVDGTPAVFAPDGSKIGGYLTPDQLQAQLERIAAMNKSGS